MHTMSIALVAGVIGFAVGYGVGVWERDRRKQQLARDSLEEGFRTFIEHHTDLDRQSEHADKLWRATVAQKRVEKTVSDFAKRRRR